MIKKIKYNLQVFQKDLFWFPFAMMSLFLIISIFTKDSFTSSIPKAFLGYLMPLIAGGLAAYAYLEDQALELKFTFNQRNTKFIFKRLSVVLIISIIVSICYQIGLHLFQISIDGFTNTLQLQLSWFIPVVANIAFASFISLVTKSSNLSFSLIGGIWILQVIARGFFSQHTFLSLFLLFQGTMVPGTKQATINYISLLLISLVSILFSLILIKKQERYI